MKCSEVEKKMVLFLDDGLPLQMRFEIEDHLKSCVKCAQLAEKFSQVWDDLENPEEIQPNPFFWTRLKQKIDEYERKQYSPAQWLHALINGLRPAFVVAVLIGGILLGNWLGNFSGLNDKTSEQESALEEFLSYQVGDLPPGSIEEFYLSLDLEN